MESIVSSSSGVEGWPGFSSSGFDSEVIPENVAFRKQDPLEMTRAQRKDQPESAAENARSSIKPHSRSQRCSWQN